MYQLFTWHGKPIYDIEEWAKERGEAMISYEEKQETPYGPEFHYGKMPESFWNSLAWTGGRSYRKL
jgi:hypothetical protein